MEVAGADAGDVTFLGTDIQELGVNLQSLHAIYHVYSFLLHALAPLDIALLVEACEQFHYGSHLLAVACSTHKSLYNLGVVSQSVEGCLYLLHVGMESRLTQHSDVGIERVVRHMYEPVFLPDLLQNALFAEKLLLHDMFPFREFQFAVSEVRELHQILMVLVSTAWKGSIEMLHVEACHNLLLHILRHELVVDDAHRLSTLSAVHALCYQLQHAVVGVVVHFHLGILCEFEGISLESAWLESDEYQRQTEAYDIIEIDSVLVSVGGRQYDEASELTVGNLHNGIVRLWFLAEGLLHLGSFHDEVNPVVLQLADFRNVLQPNRVGGTVQLVVVEILDILFLFVVQLLFVEQSYIVLFKLCEHLVSRFGIFLAVYVVQFVYRLDGALQMFLFLLCTFVCRFKESVQ